MHLSATIPPQVEEFAIQEQRCLKQLASKETDLEKFTYLSSLRVNQVHLFYRVVLNHFTQLTPLIYTPAVGEACLQWSEIYQQPDGMYLSYDHHKGQLSKVLNNWQQKNVAMTMITGGSRILGLGDIGVNGMGIPIGKLSPTLHAQGSIPSKSCLSQSTLVQATKSCGKTNSISVVVVKRTLARRKKKHSSMNSWLL
jgi:malate dehydrogenase (oxaloacetate-decarboxylating)(NADP+)